MKLIDYSGSIQITANGSRSSNGGINDGVVKFHIQFCSSTIYICSATVGTQGFSYIQLMNVKGAPNYMFFLVGAQCSQTHTLCNLFTPFNQWNGLRSFYSSYVITLVLCICALFACAAKRFDGHDWTIHNFTTNIDYFDKAKACRHILSWDGKI